MSEEKKLEITGTIEYIIFQSETNGFTVLELSRKDGLITVVGEMPNVSVGDEITAYGKFVNHKKFGTQFQIERYERKLPSTAVAICKYLSSGVIVGLSESIAKKIVEKFGDQTLTILESDPSRISEVEGIGKRKSKTICEEFKRVLGMSSVLTYLSKYELTMTQKLQVWKKWGVDTQETIEENPYLLCNDEIRVNFEKLDGVLGNKKIKIYGKNRTKAAFNHVIMNNLKNGHSCVPKEQLLQETNELLAIGRAKLADELELQIENNSLMMVSNEEDEFIYLKHLYEAEEYIAHRLKLFIEQASLQESNYSPDMMKIIESELGINLEEAQRQAIETAVINPIMILTGGPGTGKTTTLNGIIRYFNSCGLKVSVCAPTGRAAKRVSELTGYEAKTIHRLLEVDFMLSTDDRMEFVHNEKNPLDTDVVIVDEMSMVDVLLFEKLLRGIKMSTKLILVGDCDQLPPVGAGNVLGDLLHSGKIAYINLCEVFRQAAQSLIVTNSHMIVRGEIPNVEMKDNDFFFLKTNNNCDTMNLLEQLCNKRLPAAYDYDKIWDIQVISPSRVGEIGTNEINKRLQSVLNCEDSSKCQIAFGNRIFREGDKIMQMRNNYNILWKRPDGEEGSGIFNGDIGEIIKINRHKELISIKFDDRYGEYTYDMLDQLELAYAITVHKSQGSEFDVVIIPLMDRANRLYYRNLLYTAVTRARKLLILLGKFEIIKYMVMNDMKSNRYSNIKWFLNEGEK